MNIETIRVDEGRMAMYKHDLKYYLVLGWVIVFLLGCEEEQNEVAPSVAENATAGNMVLSCDISTDSEIRKAGRKNVYMFAASASGGAGGNLLVYQCEKKRRDNSVDDGEAGNGLIYFELPPRPVFQPGPGLAVEKNPVKQPEIFNI
jgi:hypothetical protein